MENFDYKKYSLEQLEKWIHDTILSSNATPQEIYDVIKKSVTENYYIFKHQTNRCYELLALLNGNGEHILSNILKEKEHDQNLDVSENSLSCDRDDQSEECKKSWNSFWEESGFDINHDSKKPKQWVLPVQLDGLTGECYINLPDDFLDIAGLKENDTVYWIDRNDGSYELRKFTEPLKPEDC